MLNRLPLILAQAEEAELPPVSPQDLATTAVEAQDGSVTNGGDTGQGDAQGQKPGGGNFLFMIMLIFLVMFIFMMGGQRKEKKKRKQMIQSLAKGAKIQTVGGILGTVLEVRDNEIIVKVDESSNTRMRFSRSAVQTVLDDKAD